MRKDKHLPYDQWRGLSVAVTALALVATGCTAPQPAIDPAAHRAEVETWRSERLERLTQPDGWPSLVALHWLEDEVETFGSSPEAELVLPGDDATIWGRFVVEDGEDGGRTVRIEAEPGAGVTHDGDAVESLVLTPDVDGEPTVLERSSVQFYLIERGGEPAIRAKDLAWLETRGEPHVESFPIDPAYRLEARFIPYDPPKKIPVINILGQVEDVDSPGAVEFELEGETYRLDGLRSAESMFLIVGDETNAESTYGGGRYMYVGPPLDGKVIVDFNKLYNPPCVFTEFSTCELPPRQNKLPVALRAGEKDYGEHWVG